MSKYIITFYSHYEALKARRELKEGRLISVPRTLSSSCGTAMEVEKEDSFIPSFKFEVLYKEEKEKYIKVLNG